MGSRFLSLLGLGVLCIAGASAMGVESLAEPGPENAGLRLRLTIRTERHVGQDTHHVQLDLLNVTDHPITLQARWSGEQGTGDFKDYLEAAASLETYPETYHEYAQTGDDVRKSPQPEYVLNPKDALTVRWTTTGRKLKNKVLGPNDTHNPEFPADGLYAIHVLVFLGTPGGDCLLRSNEQQVSVGGSRKMPRHMCGDISWLDPRTPRAGVNLGSLQGIKAGDRFLVSSDLLCGFWCLEIASVSPSTALGVLFESDAYGRRVDGPKCKLPRVGYQARLITESPPQAQGSAASRPAR